MQIRELAPGIHLHISFQHVEPWGWVDSNGLVVFDGNDAYLIDTPWSPGDTRQLVEWIEARGAVLQGSLSTHSHDDRAAGIGYLNATGIPTHASELTNQFLARVGKPTAMIAFPGPEFDWLPGKITAFHPGGGHTQDNLVVWIHEHHLLVGGCLVRARTANGLGYTGEAMIKTWAESARRVKSKYPEAQMVIPGHGPIGDIQLLDHTASLAESARRKGAQGTK